jgi:succinyl-diaminopimelate desuccinylase
MREIIDLTKKLIRFKSTHTNKEEIDRCSLFIEDYFKRSGIPYQRREHGGYPSIVVMPAGGHVPVLLMAHIDVVDAPDKLFEPVEKNNRLYGRGSIDDKYAVALAMVLVRDVMARRDRVEETREPLPLGVLITSDEEIGGKFGAEPLLKEIRADFCIALDGGAVDQIVIKEKGILKLKLISRGKAAHGARPWLGENAIDRLIDDYQTIKTFFRETEPHHWHRTLNFSIIHAGQSHNQVPEYAEAKFDIRYTENDDAKGLIDQMREAVQGELVVEGLEPVFQGGGPSPYLDLLLDISSGTRLGFEHGASDARYLSVNGMDGVVWGADGDLSQHAEDEHVNIDSVYRLYEILAKYLDRIGEIKR